MSESRSIQGFHFSLISKLHQPHSISDVPLDVDLFSTSAVMGKASQVVVASVFWTSINTKLILLVKLIKHNNYCF